MTKLTSVEDKTKFDWKEHIAVVDSSLSSAAIDNITKIDTQMLFHMDNLQDQVQKDLTNFNR